MIKNTFSSTVFMTLILLVFVLLGVPCALAVTFTVNSTADVVAAAPLDNGLCETLPGNNVCTLRAAIMKANHFPGGGATINFGLPGIVTYTLAIPSSNTDDELTGDLNINNAMNIVGNGANNTIIDGNGSVTNDRVFFIGGGVTATISGVTIRNGKPAFFTIGGGNGGGIYNTGILTLTNSIINANASIGAGGGIRNLGTTRIMDSIISANSSSSSGGGINNGGTMRIVNSTVSGNTAPQGGGINSGGIMVLLNSTVNGNTAGEGSGILNDVGTLTALNSTVSGNFSKANGGGIYALQGTTELFNVTVTDNIANEDGVGSGTGGGVYNNSNPGTLNFRIQNSIIAGNGYLFNLFFFNDDCAGTISSRGNNIMSLIDPSHCTVTGPVTVAGPNLGPLQNNGGPTQTHALLTGSPAIDAGNLGGCIDNSAAILTTDQRGSPRPAFGATSFRCDIGAYELQQTLYLPLIKR